MAMQTSVATNISAPEVDAAQLLSLLSYALKKRQISLSVNGRMQQCTGNKKLT
jgi:hypothetical protein